MVENKTAIEEIKAQIKTEKIIMGLNVVLKKLKSGELVKVYTTSNCPSDTIADLEHYAGLTSTELVDLGVDNEEVGIICKRSHVISVLGLLK